MVWYGIAIWYGIANVAWYYGMVLPIWYGIGVSAQRIPITFQYDMVLVLIIFQYGMVLLCVMLPPSLGRKRWVLFPPYLSRKTVKGRHYFPKGMDDDPVHWFAEVHACFAFALFLLWGFSSCYFWAFTINPLHVLSFSLSLFLSFSLSLSLSPPPLSLFP